MQAAVGHICPSCVTWERNPVAQVASSRLLTAVGAGLGAGILLAIAISVLSAVLGGTFFGMILWAVAGYLIGQAVHVGANRSRARSLRYVAGGSAAFSWAVAMLFGIGIVFSPIWLVFAVIQVAIAIAVGDCAVPLVGAIVFRVLRIRITVRVSFALGHVRLRLLHTPAAGRQAD